MQLQWCSVHTGYFNALVPIGKFAKRLPVAAKTALITAGTTAEVPASPIPPAARNSGRVDLDGRRLRKMRQHTQPTPEIDKSLARLDRVYSR
jgi:hypothetical protein